MPLVISHEQQGDSPALLRRTGWTRQQLDALESTGALAGRRYELIEGELIDKTGAEPPHILFVTFLHGWLTGVFGVNYVRCQAPIDASPEDSPTSTPEPDLCVTTKALWSYPQRLPRPDEVLLLVEVADSTLTFDTTAKANLYARAGIAEYWVVDTNTRRILVHRMPESGEYRSRTAYDATEGVAPLAAPHAILRLSDHLGN